MRVTGSAVRLRLLMLKTQPLDWIMTDLTSKADLLEGEMASVPVKQLVPDSVTSEQMDTLDEPIAETLLRDLRGIGEKMKHVILPTSKSLAYRSVLKDWDLWASILMHFCSCLTS